MRHKWKNLGGKRISRCLNCGAIRDRGFIPAHYKDYLGKYYYGEAPQCPGKILNEGE